MNIKGNQRLFRLRLAAASLFIFLFLFNSASAQAAWWEKYDNYWQKIGGKFVYGLEHSLFSWVLMWTESREPQYTKEWEGFWVGISKIPIYTGTGLIQLVTFPIPVNVPDIGLGLHMPDKNCPAAHYEDAAAASSEAPAVNKEVPAKQSDRDAALAKLEREIADLEVGEPQKPSSREIDNRMPGEDGGVIK